MKYFCDLSLMLETCIKHVNQIIEFSNFNVQNRKKNTLAITHNTVSKYFFLFLKTLTEN